MDEGPDRLLLLTAKVDALNNEINAVAQMLMNVIVDVAQAQRAVIDCLAGADGGFDRAFSKRLDDEASLKTAQALVLAWIQKWQGPRSVILDGIGSRLQRDLRGGGKEH